MIETIQFKRGLEANLPRLADGEPAFCEDTQNVYIGSSSGNKLVFSGSLTDYLNKLGDLTQLQTTDKDTLVHAINDNVASLAEKALQSDLNTTNANVTANTSAITSHSLQISANSTAITNIGNGSPKGVYTTLSALQTAFPTGTTGIYLVTADGKWYYWSGSAWTAGGTYQSTGIAQGGITPDLTSFMVIGKNLFNPATVTNAYMVDFNTGALAANTDHVVSDYISVSPNTSYVVNKTFNLAFYDLNKAFITPAFTGHSGTFTTPSNCVYIRLSISTFISNPNVASQTQLELGTISTSFVSYGFFLNKNNMPVITNDMLPTITASQLPTAIVTEDKTSFMILGKNLFNPSTITTGKMVDFNSGALASNTDHIASDYMAVTPNTVYVANKTFNLAFYDSNKTFISPAYTSHTGSFTTPSNCTFIRMSFSTFISNPNLASQVQVELGTVSTTYVSYGFFLNKNNISITNDMLPTLTSLPDKIVNVNNTVFFIVGKNIYDKTKATDGYLVDGAHGGGFLTWATHSMSDWIPVIPNLSYVFNHTANYGFYDTNKVFISGANALGIGIAIVAPASSAYIRFSIDITSGTNQKDITQLEQGTNSTNYVPFQYILDPKYLNSSSNTSWYNGKKLTTLGDSITAGATWQPYLMSKLGFASYTNCGVGGTKIADDGSSTGMVTDSRISTIPLDSDVILLMGGTNDYGSVPLGDLSYPYNVTTFKGAIAETIVKLQARCPNALIVCMSLLSGRGSVDANGNAVNQTAPEYNSLGLTSEDYAYATRDVCHFMSTPFIDVFGGTGINQFNRATYISDTVHPNASGGTLMARVIVNGLKAIEPVS
jgi:lysophospholipase L1-like esterase